MSHIYAKRNFPPDPVRLIYYSWRKIPFDMYIYDSYVKRNFLPAPVRQSNTNSVTHIMARGKTLTLRTIFLLLLATTVVILS